MWYFRNFTYKILTLVSWSVYLSIITALFVTYTFGYSERFDSLLHIVSSAWNAIGILTLLFSPLAIVISILSLRVDIKDLRKIERDEKAKMEHKGLKQCLRNGTKLKHSQ